MTNGKPDYSARQMLTLPRYLFWDVMKPTLVALVVLLSLVWLMQSLRFLDFIINKGLGVDTFLQLTLGLVPTLLMIILPLAVFAGVVYGARRLLDDNELAVLLATGRSRLRVALPSMALALLGVAAGYVVSLWALPESMRYFKNMQYELRTMDGQLLLEEGTFNQLGDLMVYLKKRSGNDGFEGLLVHDTRRETQPVTWLARKGRLEVDVDGTPRLILEEGLRQDITSRRVTMLQFAQQTLDIRQGFGPTPAMAAREPEPEEMYYSELTAKAKAVPAQRNELLTEANRRLLWPLTPLPLVLLATGIMLQRPQRHQGSLRRIAPAVGLAMGYYALLMSGNSWGESYGPDALLALWLLPAGTMLVGMGLLMERRHD